MSHAPSLPEHEDLATAIAELAVMINETKVMSNTGQLIELDLLAMRIAVLCDAIASLPAERARPLRPALETLMSELDGLDYTLRRRNVDISLDLQQADRRLRAKFAYSTPSSKVPSSPAGHK